jgi:hypothetical protein
MAQMIAIESIQPERAHIATRKPRRAPRFVPRMRYVPPISVTTMMMTTR